MEVGSKLDKFLGSGAEGTVYYVDGYAVKIFHKLDLNKLYKISTMMEMEHYNLVLPIDYAYVNGKIVGYVMPYIEKKWDLSDAIHHQETIAKKIEILLELQDTIITAHKMGLQIIDFNPRNFIIDKNNIMHFIDTDNYFVNEYKNDINPLYFYRYYKFKVTPQIDQNFDKFQFFMYALDYIAEEKMDDKRLLYYRPEFTYLEDYINHLDIPIDIRDTFLKQASTDPNKIYLTDAFEELKSKKGPYLLSK